jgi:hypothetical protein
LLRSTTASFLPGSRAYRIDRGTIKGVDRAGVPFAVMVRIPGNILQGCCDVVYAT